VRFRVLGPLDVVLDGRASAPAGAKERVVLARLLLDAGRAVATDTLLETAWPGTDRERARRSLHIRLAHLRGFLEPERPAGAASTLLVREGAGYRLTIEPEHVDAVRFGRLVGVAGSLAPGEALDVYDEALALWRGRPFADLPDDESVLIEVRRLEELHAHAAVARARALVELGRHEEVLPELRRLAAADLTDEELVRTLALALYRAGRQVEALNALRELGQRLRELGLERSVETRELERRILVHDAALAVPRPAVIGAVAAPALPRRVSRFFGRAAHLAHAGELVGEGALVTIVGVGGAGKTRLALEFAEREREHGEWTAGPWWCELAPVADDGDVAGTVASALGVEAGGVDRIAEHVGSRSALVVLDNCEHVLDGVAAVVESLLASCPGLVVVATSRAPLGIDGEQVLRLSGLDLPAGHATDAADAPAVALFLDRARAVGGVIDEDADLDTIGELCRRLDGLPLAIELAAGRTRSQSPREIAARLDERLSLLSVSGRRAAARHRTLRAAIDWSYRLLDDTHRRLFERLSVFARGCALADAESVCAGDGVDRAEVAALLDELVANSLVTVTPADGRTRYGLLETLREYARERLQARGETDLTRDRHADHYVQSALELRRGWPQATVPFVEEFDELRAALRWCLATDHGPDRAFVLAEALWWLASVRNGDEVARLCDEALDCCPDPHPWQPRTLGAALPMIEDAATARRSARDALGFERPDDEPALLARRTLAQLAFFSRDMVEALRLWREQGTLARAAGYDVLGCEADGFVVQLLQATGDTVAAIALAEQMRDEADRMRGPSMINWSRYVSGIAVIESSPEQARRWLNEAGALSRAADQHHMTRFSLRALGIAATMHGDHDEAARRLAEALEHDEATADTASQWSTLLALGVLLARLECHEPAAEILAVAHDWPAAPFLTALATRERERLTHALDAGTLATAEQRGRSTDLGDAKRRARTALAAAVA
jgi:predicted ATPase/DNA-binding SARP family transcriptional activator